MSECKSMTYKVRIHFSFLSMFSLDLETMTDYHASFHLLERTSEQKVEKNRQTFLPNVDQMFYSPREKRREKA